MAEILIRISFIVIGLGFFIFQPIYWIYISNNYYLLLIMPFCFVIGIINIYLGFFGNMNYFNKKVQP